MSRPRIKNDLRYGEKVELYHKGRKDYPQLIIDLIHDDVGHDGEAAIDVGCGTGIATRQLAAHWCMTGVDLSGRMIMKAKYLRANLPPTKFSIAYRLGAAHMLPCDDGSQRLVTAFGAFQHFATFGVLHEWQRALVPGGSIAIVHQKSQPEDRFRVAWRSIVSSYLKRRIETPPEEVGYNPRFVVDLIRQSGFVDIRPRRMPHVEVYAVDEAMARVLFSTDWRSIPIARQPEAEADLQRAFEDLRRSGERTITRLTDVWAVFAKKPE